MKKLPLLIACFLCTNLVFGQSRYMVFKISGEIYSIKDSSCVSLNKRDYISLNDKIQIGPSSQIGILDTEVSQIFYSTEEGTYRVFDIISNAKKQADKVTKLMNTQIRASNRSQNNTNHTYNTAGVTYRGSSENTVAGSIYSALCNRETFKKDSTIIHLDKVFINPDEYYFSITNCSEQPLYINVLKTTSTSSYPTLCFNIGYTENEPFLLVAANSTLEVTQYMFSYIENENIVLFATPIPFDSQELQVLLKSEKEPSCINNIEIFFYSL